MSTVVLYKISSSSFMHRRNSWRARKRVRVDQNLQTKKLSEQLRCEHLERRADGHHPAVLQQHYPVGKLGGEIDVMSHDYGRRLASITALPDQFQHRGLVRQIEIR